MLCERCWVAGSGRVTIGLFLFPKMQLGTEMCHNANRKNATTIYLQSWGIAYVPLSPTVILLASVNMFILHLPWILTSAWGSRSGELADNQLTQEHLVQMRTEFWGKGENFYSPFCVWEEKRAWITDHDYYWLEQSKWVLHKISSPDLAANYFNWFCICIKKSMHHYWILIHVSPKPF